MTIDSRSPLLAPEVVRDALLDARTELREVRRGMVKSYADPVPDDEGSMLPISERGRVLTAMIDRHLEDIETALHRLDRGMYGICAACGAPIPPRRLQALPMATLCLPCQIAADPRGRVTL